MITKLREKTTDLISGEITLTVLDFCLIGLICLFAGIAIGMLISPITRGIQLSLFSNNGNDSANNNGNNCGRKIGVGANEESEA